MNVKAMDEVLAQLRATAAVAQGTKAAPTAAAATPGVDFGAALANALQQVNGRQQESAQLARDFAAGKPDTNLTDVMVAMQKSTIAFQATVQVRNRLVAAYQDMMNMQV